MKLERNSPDESPLTYSLCRGYRSMKKPLLFVAMMIAAAACGALAAHAEETRVWRQSGYEDFEKGTPTGVAIRSDGKVVLAPRFREVAAPDAAYLWTVRRDSVGNLFAAGGTNAKVFRIDPAGKVSVVFESQELAVQALAIDAKNNLYAATSPDGKVYRIQPAAAGKPEVFFDPQTRYIWDLALDPSGNLYVATGDKGEIFRVKPDGKGESFYKSEETHVRALAWSPQGYLLAGTEPNGLLLRITPAGQGFVLYETPRREVSALSVDAAGSIYVGAIGEKVRVPAVPTVVPQIPSVPAVTTVIVPASGQATITTTPQQPTLGPAFVPFPVLPGGSDVYRVAADGFPQKIWSSREDLVYGLVSWRAGTLLVATGNRGQIVGVESQDLFQVLAKTSAAQVTGFVTTPEGKTYLCTANPGKIFELAQEYETEGSLLSDVFDAKIFSQWGRMRWWGDDGATDSGVTFFTRSGNTSNPENNWSPWAGPLSFAGGERTSSPKARFIQWKAVFKSRATNTPSLSWVELAYLPRNVAPQIDSIVVQAPGVKVQEFPVQPQQPSVQLTLPEGGGPGSTRKKQEQLNAPRFESPPQAILQKGTQSVLWSARDENEDELVFAIYYRGEGEKNWKLLKDKLTEKYYTWDSTTMADGGYYLKIVASDAPSNPPELALKDEKTSERFEIDNTPPAVLNLRYERTKGGVKVLFDARDSYSPIKLAEYSLDADDWLALTPEGGTTDSPRETYAFELKSLAAGEHTIAVRLTDRLDNVSTSKLTFSLP
jgi:hypothetical protein